MAKPYFKHFIRRLNPWNLLWPHKGKTLKSQLLKKLSIEFYETQDLSSTHRKPKLLFYDYSCEIFFLQPIAKGNCVHDMDPNQCQYPLMTYPIFNQMEMCNDLGFWKFTRMPKISSPDSIENSSILCPKLSNLAQIWAIIWRTFISEMIVFVGSHAATKI